ncbi:MAG: hypothetical protein L0220_10375 [Acidobacteria bacterium]|nr:hypothetical protein [Acidobacteriota bacterium]
MISYGDDEYPSEDDDQFYKDTVYNEDYYTEKEQEMIRQSNLDLELERLEDESLREMREEGLLRPTLVKPNENNDETDPPVPPDSSDDPGDMSF